MRSFPSILGGLLIAAAFLASPMTASAQSHGCPWCTTPTTCGEVDENTNIGGCYNIGAGCQEIQGSCTIQQTLAPDFREEALEGQGLDYLGEAEVDIYGLKFEAIQIAENLYARWKCDGRLEAAFSLAPDGTWVELDLLRFGTTYDLTVSGPQ